MKIIEKSINDIIPYHNNPRKNNKAIDYVASSIKEYGFQQPIVVDKDNVIIVGHTRYEAAMKLGCTEVPVQVADQLTEKQVKAYRIADNKTNEYANWDDNKLLEELTELNDTTIAELSELTAFNEGELLSMLNINETEIDSMFEIGDGEESKSKPGTVWILGDHHIMHGSSTDSNDISKVLDGEMIDMVWEDPPYGVNYSTANNVNKTAAEVAEWDRKNKIQNDNLTNIDEFINDHFKLVRQHMKPGATLYWSHDIRFNKEFRNILENNNTHVADTLIWRKNTLSHWMGDYRKFYEPILYGWVPGGEHIWQGLGRYAKNATSQKDFDEMTREELLAIIKTIPTNYQEHKTSPKSDYKMHPTTKPVKMIETHIINSSVKGDIVFDGFLGSGSTLIACEKTNRQCRGLELEGKYIDTIIQRWQEETGLQAEDELGNKWDDM